MAPRAEKSQLKRLRGSLPDDATQSKKPRRSDRLLQATSKGEKTPIFQEGQLPTPVTRDRDQDDPVDGEDDNDKNNNKNEDDGNDIENDNGNDNDNDTGSSAGRCSRTKTAEPTPRKTDEASWTQSQMLSSPPQDTQPLTQPDRYRPISDEVEDEAKEGVWGYLLPLDAVGDGALVLKKRSACPLSDSIVAAAAVGTARRSDKRSAPLLEEEAYDRTKIKGVSSHGYLIGRHPECDVVISDAVISNRHCLIFFENKGADVVVIVEDLSSNGTYVNDAIVGRNKRRELQDQDEIAVAANARFIFRYPRSRRTSLFLQKYSLLQKLGKGHFAEVYLCVEKSTGQHYAVKIFTKTAGKEELSKTEGLQQEIGVLMGVSHPNVLCLKENFDEGDHVYLVLELAPEGELFNYIVMKQKLSEDETRKLFRQLFQGIKYLHERNIVHRDIKPENILIVDKQLHVKLADFGLAKIIGEQSFTSTLCGTPSYVAPEILAGPKHRKYTKAIDIWSLGVVLYICLCGFPPFSDELFSRDFPYRLSDQITHGRFDYPSPYWDSVGDLALDLIDSMLVVDPDKRFAVDECLKHPWMTQSPAGVNDSTDGLVDGISGLDVKRRAPYRERTLLASVNSCEVAAEPCISPEGIPIKIFSKNKHRMSSVAKEIMPDNQRAPSEFIQMGGKGDEQLFAEDSSSIYPKGGEGVTQDTNKGPAKIF